MLRDAPKCSTSSQHHPETLNYNSISTLMGLGFSEEDAKVAAGMWAHHTHGGRVMSDVQFNECLLEGFAKSFCNTCEESLTEMLQ